MKAPIDMFLKKLLLCLCAPLALWPAARTSAQATAEYTLTFTSTWSAATHPSGFPSGAHYSPLRGATHNGSVEFWSEDSLASSGIKRMAETGNNSDLNAEITAAKNAGSAQNDIIGGGLNPSPGSLTTSFSISETHSLVTVVSMLAPSPDWFIGLSGVGLYKNGSWVADTTFTLYAYDAGTDSGVSYTAANQPTVPPDSIFKIVDVPFLVSSTVTPVGTIRFELEPSLGIEFPDLETVADQLVGPYPNPADLMTTLEVNFDRETTVEAAVFDLLGRRVVDVFSGRINSEASEFHIDTSMLTSGTYFLRFATPQGRITRVFSVSR